MLSMSQIPNNLQGVLWSSPVNKLDLNKNKEYIIHQVLMFGKLEDIRWLFDIYSYGQIKEIFLTKPHRVYTRPALNFINKFVLKLNKNDLPTEKYVNTVY
jgi:hypothetical protein